MGGWRGRGCSGAHERQSGAGSRGARPCSPPSSSHFVPLLLNACCAAPLPPATRSPSRRPPPATPWPSAPALATSRPHWRPGPRLWVRLGRPQAAGRRGCPARHPHCCPWETPLTSRRCLFALDVARVRVWCECLPHARVCARQSYLGRRHTLSGCARVALQLPPLHCARRSLPLFRPSRTSGCSACCSL